LVCSTARENRRFNTRRSVPSWTARKKKKKGKKWRELDDDAL
jgi:hypothetical protein